MSKFAFGAVCLLLAATAANAQIFRGGRPVQVYQPPVVMQAPVYSQSVVVPASSGQLSTSVTCCDTPSNSNCPDCKYTDGIRITPKGNCGSAAPIFKPYDIKCEATLTKKTDTVKFYKDIIKKEVQSEVPEEYTVVYETVDFKACVVDLPCCTLEFCIPCGLVCTEKKECRMVKQKVNVELRVRTSSGNIDVVAIKVPGMPTEYLLGRDLSKDEVKKRFGVDIP